MVVNEVMMSSLSTPNLINLVLSMLHLNYLTIYIKTAVSSYTCDNPSVQWTR